MLMMQRAVLGLCATIVLIFYLNSFSSVLKKRFRFGFELKELHTGNIVRVATNLENLEYLDFSEHIILCRVATNLENLEYSDFAEHIKLREFSGSSVQPQGRIVTKYF